MPEPLKNGFDRAVVERVAASAGEAIDQASFITAVMAELESLELKDRINLIADQLHAHLPNDYPTALAHVVEMARSFVGGMQAWPLCSVVERHGLVDPAASLTAMEQLTQSFSCEFAIRPFLDAHLDLTLESCRRWVESPIATVRRLPSEGTRPYLPWGPKVQALLDDPTIGLDLIAALRHDPDEVVRRSVANHLNDVARHHPDRVADLATEWLADPRVEPSMVRHALRSLIKKGHPAAMAALGFTTEPAVDVVRFGVTPTTIGLGDTIEFATEIRSTSTTAQRLVVDFVIHHVNANGATSPKVFKWTTIDLEADAAVVLTKRRLIATASTRRYHAGPHRVELQIAGTASAEAAFALTDSS